MYDTIRCDYPLPNPGHQTLEYQTKDLECMLGEYTITHEGRLVLHPGKGLLARQATRDVECPHHGDIRIYTSLERPRRRGEWVEYLVRFTEGRVQRVRRIGLRLLPKPRRIRRPRPRLAPAGAKTQLPPPKLRGRLLTADQFLAHKPERLELIGGILLDDHRLARLLLVNMGLARVTQLAPRAAWRKALASGERSAWRP
jgi:hypothetical protein